MRVEVPWVGSEGANLSRFFEIIVSGSVRAAFYALCALVWRS